MRDIAPQAHLEVRKSRVQPHTPVDEPFCAIEETGFVQTAEVLHDGFVSRLEARKYW